MKYVYNRPTLYVDKYATPETREARRLLKNAGFVVNVKIAPRRYRAVYGTPVLFGLFNRFEGLHGIHIFLKNAARL